MRIFTIIFSVIAITLIIYNSTKIDINSPFEGESIIAVITIVSALCATLLLQILRISKIIETKIKQK